MDIVFYLITDTNKHVQNQGLSQINVSGQTLKRRKTICHEETAAVPPEWDQ